MNNADNKNYGFSKDERLCSRALIDKLYSSPQRELFFPLSLHWMEVDADSDVPPVRILIVVPKRKLRHAVDRNRAKRLIRECYRLHKHPLCDALQKQGRHIVMSLNFIHTHTPNFHKLETTMEKLIRQMVEATDKK